MSDSREGSASPTKAVSQVLFGGIQWLISRYLSTREGKLAETPGAICRVIDCELQTSFRGRGDSAIAERYSATRSREVSL